MYRILRNNKEQGPYSLDELVQLSLRPYDLVWVEGKSASWRYPSEIEDLKPYISGSPITDTQSSPSLTPQVQHKAEPPELVVNANNVELEEPELTADMLEQKANAIYQRIQAYNAQQEQEAKDVQTKYARSLDDLKQDYADWLHGKKHKRHELNASSRGWVAFGAVSAAFILFVLAGKDKEMVVPSPLQQDLTSNQYINTSQDENQAKSSNSLPLNELPENAPEEQLTSIQYFIDSVRTVLRKKGGSVKQLPENGNNAKKKVLGSQMAKLPVEVISLPKEERVVVPAIKNADLDARYIPSENSTRIKEIQVTVHNTGTIALKQVLVDVFYYKKGDRFVEKETLFFNDIKPGNAFTVSKPANKKAVTARFELGELTADN